VTRIGFVQYEVVYGDWEGNVARARAGIAAAGGADLLVLPELAFTGYDFPSVEAARAAAEPFGVGRSGALLAGLAAESGAVLVAGYAELAAAGCYNAAMLATPGGDLHNYRKIHLFNREQDLFLPGDAAAPVIETSAGRVGLMICFDWFFPETMRSLALRGAEVVAHPSNLVLPWCQRAMFARCIENGVFAVTANRTGTETQGGRSLTFTGASQVVGPRGAVLAQAGETGECAVAVAVDLAEARDKCIAGRNDLFGDRRPSLYAGLELEKGT